MPRFEDVLGGFRPLGSGSTRHGFESITPVGLKLFCSWLLMMFTEPLSLQGQDTSFGLHLSSRGQANSFPSLKHRPDADFSRRGRRTLRHVRERRYFLLRFLSFWLIYAKKRHCFLICLSGSSRIPLTGRSSRRIEVLTVLDLSCFALGYPYALEVHRTT